MRLSRPLDPRDETPAVRAQLALWLGVQERLAWRPDEAARALAQDPDPSTLLDRLGETAPEPDRLERARRALARVGAGLVPLTQTDLYPARLRRQLPDPPPVLALRGDPAALAAERAVAVVGARAATRFARAHARRIGRALAEAGVVVVSGLARGVDAAAHEGALGAGGRSLAFLGCGIDQVYPPEHRRLAEALAVRGAVVSELPVGAPPRAPHFPARNRLLAGIAEAVVVVEARLRSGSLVTARHAADRGIDVWAVPGGLDAPACRGTNELLRDGAWPLVEVEDLLVHLGLGAGAARAEAAAEDAGDGDGEGPQQAVLRALAEAPLPRDALARRLGLAPGELAAALLELELAGAVTVERDGRLRRLRPLRGQASRL